MNIRVSEALSLKFNSRIKEYFQKCLICYFLKKVILIYKPKTFVTIIFLFGIFKHLKKFIVLNPYTLFVPLIRTVIVLCMF